MADEETPTPDTNPETDAANNPEPSDTPGAAVAVAPPVSVGREVLTVSIEDEMRQSYLDYAMSTIIARALPDVRDGLKPVQRRILMAMSDLNLTPGAQHRKSAKIAGDTSGNYHPHGEAVVYPTMVRMAQDFSLRYPLVDGQGNFGCFTGDTKIKLLDGTEKTFAELAELPPDEVFFVYSVDHNGRVVVGEGRHSRVTRRDAELLEVTLDNGERIRCTPDHRFLLRDGTYKQAQHLTPSDSLMPGYFDTAPVKEGLNEYLRVQQPVTGKYEFVHCLADRFNAERGLARQVVATFHTKPITQRAAAHTYNHKVVSLRWLEERADVYDITVDVHHNFLLSSGVFVHNSIDGDPPAAMRYCVTANTLVVSNGGLVPMGEVSDGSEDVDIRVLSHAGVENSASKWFDSGAHPTWRVRTRHGYEVTGTSNHPLLVCRADPRQRPSFAWKTIAELEPGDTLVLDRSEQMWPEQAVGLEAYFPEIEAKSRTQRHELPAVLNEDLAFLLGALVAEGTVCDDKIEFTNTPGDFADAFQQAWARVFPTCRLHTFLREPTGYGKKPFWQMQIVSKQVVAFLRALGLNGKSATRLIPDAVLRSPQTVMAAFLRGLFEGDGAVERSGQSLLRVSLCSNSDEMLAQVQTVLLRFGIVCSRFSDAKRGTHRLCIVGTDNLHAFAGKIGFQSQVKRQSLFDVLVANSDRALSQKDYIPFLAAYVRGQAVRHREWLGKNNFDRPARLAQSLPRLTSALSNAADLQMLAFFAKTNYLYDPVVSIEDAGVQNVYSIRVDSNCHSFVANGFINHNTEARMSPFATEMLQDLDRETVDWTDNYDQTRQEPTVLPGKFPNLLCNGGEGIAVGMATKLPPHNLREIVDGAIHLLDNPGATPEDLMEHIKGPDFPTSGLILGTKAIRQAYETGRGSVIMQAKTQIEVEGGRNVIVITELPYQVIKARLIEHIADLVKQKKIDGIADLNDYSDRHGMRIVITLKREAFPKKVLNFLLKHTPMRSTFGVIMLALVNGQPRILALPQALQLFLDHRREVIVRRTQFELNKAKARAHILEGLQIALDFLDEIIALIRASRTTEIARTEMMSRYTLSQIQADAILQMQLRQLTGLERERLENEYKELLKQIAFFEDILSSPARVSQIIKQELRALKDKYGDDRRTRIVPMEAEEIGDADLIPEEEMIVSVTRDGYIKRVPKDTYPTQHRGGKGRIGATTKEEDTIEHLFIATTHHYILFFTDRGRVYRLKAYEVPQTGRQAMGTAIINLINIQPGERITATVPMKEFKAVEGYLLMATECGEVKRTPLSEFANLRNNGLIVFDIEENDALRWVAHTTGKDEVIFVTRKGMSIRFSETDVTPRSRAAGGVRGITLSEVKEDQVVGMGVVQPDLELLVIGEKGISKRTPLKDYRSQSRGGKGIQTMALSEKTGLIVDAKIVDKDDRLLIMTQNGITIRLRVDDIRSSGRSTQGVRAINLAEDDRVASVERITADKAPADATEAVQPA